MTNNNEITILHKQPVWDCFSDCYTGEYETHEIKAIVKNKTIVFHNGSCRIAIKKFMERNRFFYKNSNCHYELKESDYLYFKKLYAENEKVLRAESIFMDTITAEEINKIGTDMDMLVVIKPNRITFHKKIGTYSYSRKCEYELKIKPVVDTTYNKEEFDKKFNEAVEVSKHSVKEISEEIKMDLFNKFNIVVFEKVKCFEIGMSYKGSFNSMWKSNRHHGGTAKLKYNEFSIEKLYELAKMVHDNNINLVNAA